MQRRGIRDSGRVRRDVPISWMPSAAPLPCAGALVFVAVAFDHRACFARGGSATASGRGARAAPGSRAEERDGGSRNETTDRRNETTDPKGEMAWGRRNDEVVI